MARLTKIVLTGPESSGKSWLIRKLAAHFKAPYIKEYARQYLEKNGPQYDYEVFLKMFQGYLEHRDEKMIASGGLIFLDTDLVNYKVWSQEVFQKTDRRLEKELAKEIVDHHYLLLYPDIPWEPDPQRENPEDRLRLFGLHRSVIERWERPYQVVRGQSSRRFQRAVTATLLLLRQTI